MPEDLQVLVTHQPEHGDFAAALQALLSELLALRPADIECRSIAESAAIAATRVPVHLFIVSSHGQLPEESELPTKLDRDGARPESPLTVAVLLDGRALPKALCSDKHLHVRGTASIELEELLGRVAGVLGVGHALEIHRHRPQLEAVARLARSEQPYQKLRKRRQRAWLGLLSAAAVLATTAYALGWHELAFGRFEFEHGESGWAPLPVAKNGCVSVSRSESRAKRGNASLRLTLQLDPTITARRSGEAWVDLRQAAPADLAVPVNLSEKTLSAWVYTPARASGTEAQPNGLQLFVKDKSWLSHYGAWTNAEPDTWTLVELPLGDDLVSSEPGFDPRAIVAIGVKLGLAAQAATGFSGSIYIDSVDW